jgi:glyoxylase-like metal-dependent hydrolase (beta-lactamase superfamily II)
MAIQLRWRAAVVAGVLIGIALSASARAAGADLPDEARLGSDLEVRRLRPNHWLHVSKDGQGIPANGMIVRTPRGLLLVDTGWTEGQAERLVAWAERALGAFVVQAVVTHSHGDRTGGLPALSRRGIPVAALDLTIEKLRGDVQRLPRVLLTRAAPVHADALGFEAFFPGAGHAADNIVLWFPAERIVFGGCLVKSEAAPELGNVADASLDSWPRAVMVVPGHGSVGGPGALTHTLDLLRRPPAPAGR